MFNNPLDSFHNTVAEAKKERENFDQLLTISTPRERILVSLVAVLLILCVAWLFLGTVPRSVALDGIMAGPGQAARAEGRGVRAISWLDSDSVSDVAVGLPAVVRLRMSNGLTETHEGEVATISPVTLADRRGTAEAAMPVAIYRIEVSLSESPDLDALASGDCRIVIRTGSRAPIDLLLTRRS